MKTFGVVIALICLCTICLTGCHPKKMRPLEPSEEEEIGKPEREPKQPGWEREEMEEPLRPIKPVEGEEVVLDDIHFEYDKYNLTSEATAILRENAETLMNQRGVRILIEGHCDERGTDEYNLALGEKRALAARDFPSWCKAEHRTATGAGCSRQTASESTTSTAIRTGCPHPCPSGHPCQPCRLGAGPRAWGQGRVPSLPDGR